MWKDIELLCSYTRQRKHFTNPNRMLGDVATTSGAGTGKNGKRNVKQ